MGTILDLTSGATSMFRRGSRSSEAPDQRPSQKPPELPRPSRDSLEQELEALRMREVVVMRQLARHDHPELAGDLDELSRLIDAANAAKAQVAQGPSEEELQKRTSLERDLSLLRTQRAELDAQIEAMTMELFELDVAARRARSAGHAQALHALREAIARAEPRLRAAQVGLHALFPALPSLLQESAHSDVLDFPAALELVSDDQDEEAHAHTMTVAVPASAT